MQDFLENICNELLEGDEVSVCYIIHILKLLTFSCPQKTKDIYDKLRNILGSQESVKLYLEFLKCNNKVNLLILKNTKVCFPAYKKEFIGSLSP